MIFYNWYTIENLMMNNKDIIVFLLRNYQSDSCPLETSLFCGETTS